MSSPEKSAPRFLTRDELLSPPALKEQVVSLGFGDVLVGELSAARQAAISERLMEDKDKVDLAGHQRRLLAAGLLDPSSPESARLPLLKEADVNVFMERIGSSSVQAIVNAINDLSGLNPGSAEKN